MESWEADIERFFTPPNVELNVGVEPRAVSTLYLLRQEIQDCLFGPALIVDEDEASQKVPEHRLFAGAMVIFAGFDLLAKFAVDESRIGERFKSFLIQFSANGEQGITAPEAEIVWAYRNALMHPFGLHYEVRGKPVPLLLHQTSSSARMVEQTPHGWILVIGNEETAGALMDAMRRSFSESDILPGRAASLLPGVSDRFEGRDARG